MMIIDKSNYLDDDLWQELLEWSFRHLIIIMMVDDDNGHQFDISNS